MSPSCDPAPRPNGLSARRGRRSFKRAWRISEAPASKRAFATTRRRGRAASNSSRTSGPRPDDWQRERSARQAVAIAERFVRENGYTDFVPDDLRRLVPESIEFSRARNWLKDRHNTLKPQAVGFRKGSRNDREGWTVGFELVDPTNVTPATGRAVTMDAKGHRIRVEHMGFFLKGLDPRPD